MSLIEEETQWLSTTILPKILKDGRLVDNYSDAKADTFRIGDIQIDVIGHAEAFMLTSCYRTTINFEYDGEKIQRKMVVKVPRIIIMIQSGECTLYPRKDTSYLHKSSCLHCRIKICPNCLLDTKAQIGAERQV